MLKSELKSHLYTTLHWFGSCLGVVGIIFMVVKLIDYKSQLHPEALLKADWLGIFLLTSLYGIAGLLLARAWRFLLIYLGVAVSSGWAVWAYGVSQLAKYVPGNIFHLAGRQALGAAAGLPNWPLVKSTAWELTLQVIAGAIVSILVLPLIITTISPMVSLFVFTIVLLATLVLFYYFFNSQFLLAFCWYFLFLIVGSSIFSAMAFYISSDELSLTIIPIIASGYALAWLIGLLTPGAPAGIGVREFILYSLLERFFNSADLLTIIVVSRMMTVAGDFIFYLIAGFIFKSRRNDKFFTNQNLVRTELS